MDSQSLIVGGALLIVGFLLGRMTRRPRTQSTHLRNESSDKRTPVLTGS